MKISADGPENVIDDYFGFLCQANVWKAPPDSKHPYVEFVKRLPTAPRHHPKANGPSMILRRLCGTLWRLWKVNARGARIQAPPTTVWKKVARLMNYDAWRSQSRKHDEGLSRFAIAAEQPVLEYVERFRGSAFAEFAPQRT